MRNTDIFNLDFTSPGSLDTPPDAVDFVSQGYNHAQDAVIALERALANGCMDESTWRLLGALYMGMGHITQFNDLEKRHEATFGTPMYVMLQQPKPVRDPRRIVFEMPNRIIKDSLPDTGAVLEACASEDGAGLDFTRVRGADADGLQELAKFFAHLPRDATRPECPGVERFITTLEKTAESAAATPEMWSVLFEYKRFLNDQEGFDDLCIRYAVRFGISPPSW